MTAQSQRNARYAGADFQGRPLPNWAYEKWDQCDSGGSL